MIQIGKVCTPVSPRRSSKDRQCHTLFKPPTTHWLSGWRFLSSSSHLKSQGCRYLHPTALIRIACRVCSGDWKFGDTAVYSQYLPQEIYLNHVPMDAFSKTDLEPGYVIYRDSPIGDLFDITAPPVFFPPKDSDELFDALRLKYPYLKSHSERMRDAMIEFLLAEQQTELFPAASPFTATTSTAETSPWQQSWPSMSSDSSHLSSPDTFGLATPSFGDSPLFAAPSLSRQFSTASSATPSQTAATPPVLEKMTSVFSLDCADQPKQRIRRKMTEAEKIDYRKRRIVKACDSCAKRKRKCQHQQPGTDTLTTSAAVQKAAKPRAAVPAAPKKVAVPQTTQSNFAPASDLNFGFEDFLIDDMQLFDDFTDLVGEPSYDTQYDFSHLQAHAPTSSRQSTHQQWPLASNADWSRLYDNEILRQEREQVQTQPSTSPQQLAGVAKHTSVETANNAQHAGLALQSRESQDRDSLSLDQGGQGHDRVIDTIPQSARQPVPGRSQKNNVLLQGGDISHGRERVLTNARGQKHDRVLDTSLLLQSGAAMPATEQHSRPVTTHAQATATASHAKRRQSHSTPLGGDSSRVQIHITQDTATAEDATTRQSHSTPLGGDLSHAETHARSAQLSNNAGVKRNQLNSAMPDKALQVLPFGSRGSRSASPSAELFRIKHRMTTDPIMPLKSPTVTTARISSLTSLDGRASGSVHSSRGRGRGTQQANGGAYPRLAHTDNNNQDVAVYHAQRTSQQQAAAYEGAPEVLQTSTRSGGKAGTEISNTLRYRDHHGRPIFTNAVLVACLAVCAVLAAATGLLGWMSTSMAVLAMLTPVSSSDYEEPVTQDLWSMGRRITMSGDSKWDFYSSLPKGFVKGIRMLQELARIAASGDAWDAAEGRGEGRGAWWKAGLRPRLC